MNRFQSIDASNSSLGGHLYSSEEVFLLTPGVGLYSGERKSASHASGTVYLTSHRLFYIDDSQPHRYSCFIKLALIRETQFFAGFLKSSPKVTLTLKALQDDGASTSSLSLASSNRTSQDQRAKTPAVDESAYNLPTTSWICRVCAFSNTLPPGADPNSSVKCQLCGVSEGIQNLNLTANSSVTPKPPKANGKHLPPQDGTSCPVCTFSNHPSMLRCEMCDSPLATAENIDRLAVPSTAASASPLARTPTKTPEPVEQPTEDHVRLSFRKGGDRSFYETLKTTLKEKRWQRQDNNDRDSNTTSRLARSRQQSNIDGRRATEQEGVSGNVGIGGIMSAVDLQSREEANNMQDALQDLEALMTRAKKMVEFAEILNAKLTRQEASQGPQSQEAATLIRSSMLKLGLQAPAITPDMARDEMQYSIELAKELAGLLYDERRGLFGKGKVLMKPREVGQEEHAIWSSAEDAIRTSSSRGIMPLDEIWCIWNRARGVALVSPKELLKVIPLLQRLTEPILICKTFNSGLKAIHTAKFTTASFGDRVVKHLRSQSARQPEQLFSGLSTMEISTIENIPLQLTTELLFEVELETGKIVCDSHSGQEMWYLNEIIQSLPPSTTTTTSAR